MRVVHVIHRYLPHLGGSEILARDLCESLASRDYEVSVYTVERSRTLPREECVNGVLVKRYFPIAGDPLYMPQISFLADLRSARPDILHVHNIHSGLAFVACAARGNDGRMVLQPAYHRFGQTRGRSCLFALYRRTAAAAILKKADVVIANSSQEGRMLQEDFGCGKVRIIKEGLPLDDARFVEWCPDDENRILYVGSLAPYKNVDNLIEAFRQVLDLCASNARLVIVGSGPEKDRLVALTQALHVQDFVEWKQKLSRSELLHEYSKARVFVSLSRLESFGRTACEALFVGVPVVALRVGAIAELADEGLVDGIDSTTPERVAEAVCQAMTCVRNPIKAASSLPFQEMDAYADQISAIYEELAAGLIPT